MQHLRTGFLDIFGVIGYHHGLIHLTIFADLIHIGHKILHGSLPATQLEWQRYRVPYSGLRGKALLGTEPNKKWLSFPQNGAPLKSQKVWTCCLLDSRLVIPCLRVLAKHLICLYTVWSSWEVWITTCLFGASGIKGRTFNYPLSGGA